MEELKSAITFGLTVRYGTLAWRVQELKESHQMLKVDRKKFEVIREGTPSP